MPSTGDAGDDLRDANDLGVLEEERVLMDVYGGPDLADVYRFTVESPIELQATLIDRTEGGRLYLIHDANGNEVWDSDEDIESDRERGDHDVSLSEDLAPGEYFLWIERLSFSDSTGYSLTLSWTDHWDVLAEIDFTSVEVWTRGGLVTYYLLFVMHVATRRVHLAGCTPTLGDEYVKQVARSLTDCVDGFLREHKYEKGCQLTGGGGTGHTCTPECRDTRQQLI